jgi:hypothetical protein
MSANVAVANPADVAPKSGMLPKLMLGGFIASIIAFESLIFFFMVPNADDVAALAEQRLVEKLEERMKAGDQQVVDDSQSIEEVSLGQFGVGLSPTGSNRSYQFEAVIFGTVKKKDHDRLVELLKAREMRLRNQLLLEFRNASLEELRDIQSGLIQRRILATVNEIFEEPIILGVGFSDHQLFEQ